jgi:predicted nucleic acid-binding protein
MFRLDDSFATPDVLYREELEQHHPELPGLGLRIERLSSAGVAEVERLSVVYPGPSTNDLFALALAKERHWPLLSGDGHLRKVAEAEDVEIHGTLWIIERMIVSGTLTLARARTSLALMKDAARRLPWVEFEAMLARMDD